MSRSLDCPQLLGERKFPLPGSGSPPAGGVCPRHPHSTFFNIVFSVSLSLSISGFQFGSGTRPLVVDTLAEMPEAQNTRACPSSRDYARAYPPVRARESHSLLELNSGIRNHVSSFSVLFYFSFLF